jgi:lipooligosaccharide transport system ATP-binding protein
VVELRFPPDGGSGVLPVLRTLADRVEELPDRTLLYTTDGDATAHAVHARGLNPLTVVTRRSTLEDVFLRLTGRQLVD